MSAVRRCRRHPDRHAVSCRCDHAIPSCRGSRYREEILQVRYRDRSIADVLEMSVREASIFFRGYDKVQARLKRMLDVGLDYVKLGQPATTLSSGEGQRLKLAAFLASTARRRTLFILDEPTTACILLTLYVWLTALMHCLRMDMD